MIRPRPLLTLLGVIALFVGGATTSQAQPQTYIWNQPGGTHDWDTPTNWTGGTVYPGSGAFFDLASLGVLTSDQTINLSGIGPVTLNLNQIQFSNDGSFGYTIQNGTGANVLNFGDPGAQITMAAGAASNVIAADTVLTSALTVSNASTVGSLTFSGGVNLNASALTVNGAGAVLLTGNVSGVGGSITKTSTGILTLQGTNTFTGGVLLGAGQINLNSTTALGAAASTLTITGGTIDNTSGSANTLANNNAQNWNGDFTFLGSNALNLGTGAVTLGGNRQVTVTASTLTVGGNVGGAFGLTKAGSGTLELGGTGTYLATTVSDGTLRLLTGTALGSGTTTVSAGGTVDLNGQSVAKVFTVAGTGVGAAGALINSSGTPATITSDFVQAAGSTFTIGGTGDIEISSRLFSSAAFTVTKAGAGTLTLSGTADNGFLNLTATDGLTVLAKTSTSAIHAVSGLTINNAAATVRLGGTGGDQLLTMTMSAGTFDLNGLNESLGVTTVSGGVVTNSSTTPATLTFGTSDGAFTQSGGVFQDGAGVLNVTYSGTGTKTINVANTYSGVATLTSTGDIDINHAQGFGTGTIVIAGDIDFAHTGAGALTLTNNQPQNWNANFTFQGPNDLNIGTGAVTLSANRTVSVSAGVFTVGGSIGGTGFSLSKSSSGTMVLAGANTYTGGTIVNAGTLALDFAPATAPTDNILVPTAALTMNGGTLSHLGKAGVTSTQTYPGVTVNAGATGGSNIIATDGASGGIMNVELAGITRNGAGKINFAPSAAGTITTTRTNDASGIMGAWATYGPANGTTWAVSGTGTGPFAITGFSAFNTGFAADTFVDAEAGASNPGTMTIQSLRLNSPGAYAVTLGGTLSVSTGGVLITNNVGANPVTIANGTLTTVVNGTSPVELVLNQNNTGSPVTIASTIANPSNGVRMAVTKTGPGVLILSGNNTFTGTLNTSGGATEFQGDGVYLGNMAMGNAVTMNTTGSLAFHGVISGAGVMTKSGGTGSLTLSGVNTFTGDPVFSAGTLNLNDAASLGGDPATFNGITLNTGATITVPTNITLGGNITFAGSSNATFSGAWTTSSSRTITVTRNQMTISGVIADSDDTITKSGNGVLRLTGANTFLNLAISGGVLSVNSVAAGGSSSPLGNGSAVGTLVVNNGTLRYDSASDGSTNRLFTVNGSSATIEVNNTGGLTFSNTGSLAATASGARLLVLGANSTGIGTLTPVLPNPTSSTSSLAKYGIGTWRLTSSNTYTGSTSVLGGTLNLDFSVNATTPTSIVNASSALVLGGGTLLVTGDSGTTNNQTFASTTLASGASGVSVTQNGATAVNVTLNTLTRNVGSTLNFVLPTTGNIRTQTQNANLAGGSATILGGYAIVGGTTWAVSGTGTGPFTVTGLANGSYSSAFADTLDIDATGTTSPGATMTINSLRYSAAGTATTTIGASDTLTIATGGLLVTSGVGTNAVDITGGSLTSGNGTDLIVHQNNSAGTLTIASSITGAIGLTKSGPGALVLATGAMTFTGTTTLNDGTLTLDSTASFARGAGATVVNGGTLNLNDADALGTGAFTINGGTLNNTSGADVAISTATPITLARDLVFTGTSSLDLGTGAITVQSPTGIREFARTITVGANTLTLGGAIGGTLGLTKAGAGTLVLSGASTFTGPTQINQGTLSLASIPDGGMASPLGNSSAAAVNLLFSGGTLQFTPTAANVSTNRGFTVTAASTLNVVDAGTTLAFTGQVAGDGTLVKTGLGNLALSDLGVFSGGLIVDQGTLTLGNSTDIVSGGSLGFGSSSSVSTVGAIVVNPTLAIFNGNFITQTNTTLVNTVTIATGKTLVVNGNMTVGVNLPTSNTRLTFDGGGNFVVLGSTFQLGGATGGTNANQAILNMAALSSFTANMGTSFILGDITTGTANGTSTFTLATNNTITSPTVGIGDRTGGGVTITMVLGSGTNVINANTLNVGLSGAFIRSSGVLNFAGADTTGTLTLRGQNGTARATFNMVNTTGSTGGNTDSTVNFNNHTADLLISTLTMASRTQNTGNTTATFSFNQGTLDITTLNMASRTGAGTGSATATVNLGDSAAPGIPTVDIGSIAMAVNTSGGGTSTATLNISGGNVAIAGGINMANAAASRTSISTIALTGGTVAVGGNIVRTAGGGTETTTITLDGSTLNLQGNAIGAAGALIGTLNFRSGALTNAGEINNGAVINKTTAGALTLGGTNTFTGGVTLTLGTLNLNSSTALGATAGTFTITAGTIDNTSGLPQTIANNNAQVWNGNFTFTGSNDLNLGTGAVSLGAGSSRTVTVTANNLTVGGTIANGTANALVKNGAGTLTLNGANTYTGTTQVTQGTLSVNGNQSSATGAITVSNLATLRGTGTLGGSVSVLTGGTLKGGNSIGTLTVAAAISSANNSNLDVDFSELDGNSLIDITGAANTFSFAPVVGDKLIINLDGSLDDLPSKTYTLTLVRTANTSGIVFNGVPQAGGTSFGSPGTNFVLNTSNFTYAPENATLAVSADGTALQLRFTTAAVPEPHHLLALGTVVMAGLTIRRNRRQRAGAQGIA